MTNRASSFPAAPAIPAQHRYGGRLTAMDELPVHGLGDSFTVDGNGTVTRLPDWPRGAQIFLNFLGTPTFKNSTRLKVQGNADRTFAVGDSATLVSQGDGVWQVFIDPANGAIDMNGAPPLTGTFTGSALPANFWINQRGACISATLPEIGAQFTLTSAVGSLNLTMAYKIGFTSSVIATVGSANIYGGNIITQKGAGAHILQSGLECDQNNLDRDETTLGGGSSTYGLVSVASGSFKSTAAFWTTSSGTSWQYGYAISNTGASAVSLAGFYDGSQSTNIMLSDSAHTFGLNFFSASFSGGYAVVCPNGSGVGSANGAGGATYNIAKLDSSNILQHGDASVNSHKFNCNPASSGAAMTLTNSHATSGDAGLTIQVGSDVNTDTSTMVFFTSSNGGHLVGSITRNSGAFTVSYNTASDRWLKKNIKAFTGGRDIVRRMQPRRFAWRGDKSGQMDAGFIAQELYEVYPPAVRQGGDKKDVKQNPWQVDYSKVAIPLVSAVNEIDEDVVSIRADMAALMAEVSDLRAEVRRLSRR